MTFSRRQRGMAPLLASLLLALAAGALVAGELASPGWAARRDAASDRALAQAREALIAYAADRPITASVGPGYLPCPDTDNDGWAEGVCGSLDGERGQPERLGRLPWKTLGLADLRDGHGERLWYAVGTRFKGLLNCAASEACVDLTPSSARGTLTVRDASGGVTHDGSLADHARPGAAAVVIAPGPPVLRRPQGAAPMQQRRDCPAGDCAPDGRCIARPARGAPRCDPANYLDVAPAERGGEDNAAFHDRLGAARAGNTDGFIRGPVADAAGEVWVNDRVTVLTAAELMPRVMHRVALEVAHCLRFYATRPENGGRHPWPAPICGAGDGPAFGRVPDTPFTATRAASGGVMLERWWRTSPRTPEALGELPTASQACRIAVPPAEDAPARTTAPGSPPGEGRTAGADAPSWWNAWRPFVFYAPAAGFRPEVSDPGCASGRCLHLLGEAGRVLARDLRFAVVVSRLAGQCTTAGLDCDASRCTTVRATSGPHAGHVAVALP